VVAILAQVEAQFPAAMRPSQRMALQPVLVVPDAGLAAYVEGGAARGALDGHGRNAARVWQVGETELGLDLAVRIRILLPAREPSFPQVALNRSKCNGNREHSMSAVAGDLRSGHVDLITIYWTRYRASDSERWPIKPPRK